MATDPFELFDEWFAEAREAEINDPEAMALATADVGAVLRDPEIAIVVEQLDRSGGEGAGGGGRDVELACDVDEDGREHEQAALVPARPVERAARVRRATA